MIKTFTLVFMLLNPSWEPYDRTPVETGLTYEDCSAIAADPRSGLIYAKSIRGLQDKINAAPVTDFYDFACIPEEGA